MTAFGGALTDPTKIMWSRVGAFVIDLVITAVIVTVWLFAFGFNGLSQQDAGSSVGAADTCRVANSSSSQVTPDGTLEPNRDSRICINLGSTVYLGTEAQFDTVRLKSGAMYAFVVFLNYVLLTRLTGGTVGKLIFGLRVVTARGERAGVGRNIARSLLLFVDQFCCFFFPGLIVACNTKGHRCIGDLVAGTYVVHRSAEGRLLSIPGHLVVRNRHEFGTFGPAPATPEPTLGTGGGIDAPVFDPSRNTYVRYDQDSGVWFQWDDATQSWIPAQQ